MKHIVFLSKESVFGGHIRSNLAELVDCLACSLTSEYKVSIVCIGVQKSFSNKLARLQQFGRFTKMRFAKVNYYFVKQERWEEAYEIVNDIKPDILHVLSQPEDLLFISPRPEKTIYTFDSYDAIAGHMAALSEYDAITATSQALLDFVLQKDNEISSLLKQKATVGISNGLLTEFFSPARGLFLSKSYDINNTAGKSINRKQLLKSYDIQEDSCIFLTGSLVGGVNMSDIVRLVPILEEINAYLIVATEPDENSRRYFMNTSNSKRIIYLGGTLGVAALPTLIAGSDYFIQPNVLSLGTFVPLVANQYGTPVITSLDNIGLRDDFSTQNAIIAEDGQLEETVRAVADVFHAKISPMSLRLTQIAPENEWKNKKRKFIKIYESE